MKPMISTTASIRLGRGILVGGFLALLSLATCTHGAVVDYCEEACDCQGCDDEEHESCEIWTEAALDIASEYDCLEEAEESLDCAVAESRCEMDVYDDFGDCDNEQQDVNDCIERASDSPLINRN
jgi:hypothetical protein